MVSSADYYSDALSVIDASKQVQLLLGTSAGAITIDDGICNIATTAGPIMGRWVIDTRPPEPDWLRMAPLAQLFSGAEIEVDRDIFDSRTAMLMCDLRASDHVFAFDYILPLSPTRALIEHTVFTTRPHDPALLDPTCLAKVEQVCGSEARILRQERGWLPMGLPTPPHAHEAIVHAGARGGALRPSSGYAFRRIQKWASRTADSLVSSGKPVTAPNDSATIEFMDHVFLEALSKNLEMAPEIFLSIARALDGDGFARFMSDEARWTDWVKVVAALPKSRFLAAAGVSLSELKVRRRRPC
jgi:lycopene beta-cyclase